MDELINELLESGLHFMRCIKPNESKESFVFWPVLTL